MYGTVYSDFYVASFEKQRRGVVGFGKKTLYGLLLPVLKSGRAFIHSGNGGIL